MKNLYKFLSVSLLSFVYGAALAVPMLEIKEADGGVNKFYFDGMKVRINSSVEPEYVIIDASKGDMYIISPREKQVIDVGNLFDKEKSIDKTRFNVKFVDKGKGPSIAGFQTQHYVVMVNGKKCSDEFTSKTILKSIGVEKSLEKMLALSSVQEMEMMPGMGECEQAEPHIAAMYTKYGYPLRSIDAYGDMSFEVIKTVKDAASPSGGFSLPSGYQRVDMAQMIRDMERDMPAMSQHDMEDMSPEQIEKIQQLQQMMQEAERDMPNITPEDMEMIGAEQARKMKQMMEQMNRYGQ